jgi:hypothetical protein
MDDAGHGLQGGLPVEFGLDRRAIAKQQELGVRVPSQRKRGTGYDDRRTDIATHGVNRNSNLAGHE